MWHNILIWLKFDCNTIKEDNKKITIIFDKREALSLDLMLEVQYLIDNDYIKEFKMSIREERFIMVFEI